jgi:hypothetical protein
VPVNKTCWALSSSTKLNGFFDADFIRIGSNRLFPGKSGTGQQQQKPFMASTSVLASLLLFNAGDGYELR